MERDVTAEHEFIKPYFKAIMQSDEIGLSFLEKLLLSLIRANSPMGGRNTFTDTDVEIHRRRLSEIMRTILDEDLDYGHLETPQDRALFKTMILMRKSDEEALNRYQEMKELKASDQDKYAHLEIPKIPPKVRANLTLAKTVLALVRDKDDILDTDPDVDRLRKKMSHKSKTIKFTTEDFQQHLDHILMDESVRSDQEENDLKTVQKILFKYGFDTL